MRVSRATLRILGLLVLAITLFQVGPEGVLLAALCVMVLALALDSNLAALWWKRVAGLKWFFAAIFVLYLFGGWRIDGRPDWLEASHRVGVLITLVGGVVIMLGGLPAPELASGITTILRPLRTLDIDTAVFARRLGLTLDAVAHMQSRVKGIDRSTGFQAVATICHEAEGYSPPPHPTTSDPAASPMDWVLVFWPLALLIGTGFLR